MIRSRTVLVVACLCVTLAKAETLDSKSVIEARQQSIVKLFGAGVGTLDSYGSGVLISAEGHVVTVWNHLVNTGYLTAVVADGRRYEVEVVGTSLQHDLAVLKLNCEDDEKFTFVNFNTPTTAYTGQSVLAFSNVFHVATGNEPVSVVHGVVACEAVLNAGLGRWRFPVKTPVYVLDAVTNNSGAAGGLLATIDGAPLGLLGREIRHLDSNMWVNYAVPGKTLQPVIAAILSGQRIAVTDDTKQSGRGISDRQLTATFGMTLIPGVLDRTPAYIDRVIPGSPAAASGLKRGDLVLMMNDDVVQSGESLQQMLATLRSGQRVSLTVSRQQSLTSVSLRVP